MRKLILLTTVVIFVGLAQAQSAFDQVFGHTQVSATGYYNPAGADATRNQNGCSDWLSRSPGGTGHGCYRPKLYHTGQDMLVSSPTYTDGTPNGIGHSVYAIADGIVTNVSKGISGDASPTPGYFNQSGYVSTDLANWGTTKCETMKDLVQWKDPNCGVGIRKYNVAILVKHKIAGSNNFFWGVYGHVLDYNIVTKLPFQLNDPIVAGQPFALIGDWEGANARHLHLGIFVPNTNPNFPSIPMVNQKLGLGYDTDYIPQTKSTWQETYGFTDPIQWLTNTANTPDNNISAAGISTTNPKVNLTSVPSSISITQGGMGEIPFNLQSMLNFAGTAQGNVVSTPASILSFSDGNKVLSANATVPAKSLIYVPSQTPLGTYSAKLQTVFQDNNGSVGATPSSTLTIQAIEPPVPGGSGPTELFSTSLYTDPSLLAYYRFEGNSNDTKGGHNGSDTNMAYGSSYGKFGQGALFNGNSSNIALGLSAIPPSGNILWIHGWFNVLVAPGYPYDETIWSSPTWSTLGQLFWHIRGTSATQFKLHLELYDTKANVLSSTNTTLTTNTWYMWDVAYNATTGVTKIYINGVLDNSATFTNTESIATGAPTSLGVFATNNYRYWNGYMDDVAFFNRMPTDAEIANLYSGTPTSTTPTINAVGVSGGMTVGNNFNVYATASSVDPANIQGLIYGPGCSNGCLGTKIDATTTSYVGSFTAPLQADTYQFQLRNGPGGSLSNSQNLVINPSLTAVCSPNSSILSVNTPVTYTATVSGGSSSHSISWENGAVGTGNSVTTTYTNGGYLSGVDLYVTDSLGNQTHTTCVNQIQLGQPSVNLFGVTSSSATAGTPFDGIVSGLNFDQVPGNLQVWFCQDPGYTTCYQQPAGITVAANIDGSQAVISSINLSAGDWKVKVRNGTGTWSNLSNAFTVTAAPSGPTELFSTSLYNDPNLLAYYRFEGNSNDIKGGHNGNDTSVTYGTSYGKFGQGALLSNASNSRITVGDVNGTGNNAVTITAWIKPTSFTTVHTDRAMFGSNGFGSNGQFAFMMTTRVGYYNDRLSSYVYGIPDPGWDVNYVSSAISDQNWHHVATTIDVNNKTIKYYIDGVLDKTNTFTTTPSLDLSNVLLGSWYVNSAYRSFDGLLDDLAIFSRVLSVAEIANLYSGGQSSSAGTVNVTVSGYAGTVSCTLNGTNISAPATLNSQAAGSYTLSCTAPSGYTINSITPAATQTLSAGGTVSFAVNLASTPTPTYTFTMLNGNKSAQAGDSVGFDLNLTPVNNFTYQVTVFVSGLPANTTIASPSSLVFSIGPTSGASFTLTLQTTGSTPTGTYTLTLHAQGGGVDQYLYPTLTVTAPPPAPLSVSCYLSPNPVNLGNGSSLIGNATGGTGGYLYSLNGGSYQSSNSATVLPNDAGTFTYNVTVKDSSNTTTSNSCSVTVNGVAPTINSGTGGYYWDNQPVGGVQFSGYIYGTGFTPSTKVWFCVSGTNTCYPNDGGTNGVAGLTIQSLNTIRIINILLSTGSWQIKLQTAYGTAYSSAFTVN